MPTSIYKRMIEMGVAPFNQINPIYKYRNIEKAKEIIQTGKVFFPNSTQLSDKLELHSSIWNIDFSNDQKEKFLTRIYRSVGQEVPENISDDLFKRVLENSIKTMRDETGIFSAGKTATNGLLWENYGDNNSGVCLGFKIPPNSFGTILSFGINYTDNPQRIDFLDQNGEITCDWFYWLCTKSKSYISEEEIRLITVNYCGFVPFLKDMLFEIIFAMNTPKEQEQNIIELLKECGYSHTRIGKVHTDDKHFGLFVKYRE